MINVLCFAGSLRQESSNKKLARDAARLLGIGALARPDYLDLSDFPMVIYDADVEHAGAPASVAKLGARIAAADALVIATPEYNGGITSALKNAIDWVSRLKPIPWRGKHLLLLSASPGGWGGVRGLLHSRVPFDSLGVHVFPQTMSISAAHAAFDARDRVAGERAGQLESLLRAFVAHAQSALARRAV